MIIVLRALGLAIMYINCMDTHTYIYIYIYIRVVIHTYVVKHDLFI
jgi:hypothetical protein